VVVREGQVHHGPHLDLALRVGGGGAGR
jgi:hypothetical protein